MSADFTPSMGSYHKQNAFKYWVQKVLPLVYDDSLSYYELLAKVVDYLNNTIEDVNQVIEDTENLHDAYDNLQTWVNDFTDGLVDDWEDFRDFVTNYLQNLDVQDEINIKLDAMAEDGTLTELIRPFLENAVATQNQRISVLEGRMDTFASLPDGSLSTTADAELVDIRVGADGTTYPSAGDAVRGQYNELKSALSNTNENVNGGLVMPPAGQSIIQGSYNSSGAVTSNSARIRVSGFVEVHEGEVITFLAGQNTAELLVGLFTTEKTYLGEEWHSDGESIQIYADGYVILVFSKSDNSNITPSEYDALTTILPVYSGREEFIEDNFKTYSVTKTKNLIDRKRTRIGYLFSQSSSYFIPSANWISTDYIPVEENKTYQFSYGSGVNGVINQLQGINKRKKFVEQITASGGEFTVPSGHDIAYVVICSNNSATKAGVDTWQLEEGSEATVFAPYYEPIYKSEIIKKALSLPMFSPKKIRYVMHRGFSYFTEQTTPTNARPENTVPAFEQAGIAGAFGIETDVRETSDGYFVLMHDATVDRTTDGTGYVESMTLAQIEALTIDYGANVATYNNLKVPTLEEYLEVCAKYGCVPFIEIAKVTNYSKLIDTIRQYGMEDNCVLICSYTGSKEAVRAITNKPTILINARTGDDFDDIIDEYKNQDNIIIAFQRENTPTLTKAQVLECHESGVVVSAWTFNYTVQEDLYTPLGIDLITCELLPLI